MVNRRGDRPFAALVETLLSLYTHRAAQKVTLSSGEKCSDNYNLACLFARANARFMWKL